MQATSGFQSGRQSSNLSVNKPTRLGSSAQTLKQGRYARLMGTLWRHEKTERVGDAALGLFARILSFLADQAQDTVSEKRMVELFRGNPNGRRALNQLLAAGFMEPVCGGGYAPHDWSEHNRVTKPVKLRVVEDPAAMDVRWTRDDVVMNVPPEIIEEQPVPRARPLTQDPREEREKREDSPAESPAASAGPPETKKLKPPKKRTESGAHKRLVAALYAEAFAERHGTPASPPNWALVQAVVSWAQQTPDPEAAIRASLAGYFASWTGTRTKHPLHLWAKSPASYFAEHKEQDAPTGTDDLSGDEYRIGPDGLSDFDRQFIVRRTA